MSITQKKAFFHNNLKAEFTNKQISTNVTYTYVQDFKDIIGFRQLLDSRSAGLIKFVLFAILSAKR